MAGPQHPGDGCFENSSVHRNAWLGEYLTNVSFSIYAGGNTAKFRRQLQANGPFTWVVVPNGLTFTPDAYVIGGCGKAAERKTFETVLRAFALRSTSDAEGRDLREQAERAYAKGDVVKAQELNKKAQQHYPYPHELLSAEALRMRDLMRNTRECIAQL